MKCDLKCQIVGQNEMVVAGYQGDGCICQAESLKASI
jgi:hypothetical protein